MTLGVAFPQGDPTLPLDVEEQDGWEGEVEGRGLEGQVDVEVEPMAGPAGVHVCGAERVPRPQGTSASGGVTQSPLHALVLHSTWGDDSDMSLILLLKQPALDLALTFKGLTAEQWARWRGLQDAASMIGLEVSKACKGNWFEAAVPAAQAAQHDTCVSLCFMLYRLCEGCWSEEVVDFACCMGDSGCARCEAEAWCDGGPS